MALENKKPSLAGGCLKWTALAGAILIVAAVAAAAIISGAYRSYINSPEPALTGETKVVIEPGMSFGRISNMLVEKGVISNRNYFAAHARTKKLTTRVQAGEYAFKPGMTPAQILETITTGDVTVKVMRIPEGTTIREIAKRLEELDPAWSAKQFSQVATSAEKAKAIGVPVASLEGYLFPANYKLTLAMTEEDVIDLMLVRGLQ